MSSTIVKLASIGSPALSVHVPNLLSSFGEFEVANNIASELVALLTSKNGFYAFESALHVFHGNPAENYAVERWNSVDLWRNEFSDMAHGLWYFAEDIFGEQFAVDRDVIVRFNPETGEKIVHSETLEQWAVSILNDFNQETGYELAHEWQAAHRALKVGERLLPKIPFVLGGEYSVGNLYPSDSINGMRFRAAIARQLRDVPDGSTIELNVVE